MRQGVAAALVQALEKLAMARGERCMTTHASITARPFFEKQGYRVIYAIITEENSHSIAFHERMGYQFAARFPNCGFKFGRWLDVVWMEKRTNFVDLPTLPPAPWQSIVYNNEKLLDILAILSISIGFVSISVIPAANSLSLLSTMALAVSAIIGNFL